MFKISISKETIHVDSDLQSFNDGNKTYFSQGLSQEFLQEFIAPEVDQNKLLNEADLDNFILLVVDAERNKLQVYNDHFGSNQIYYAKVNETYIVADAIEAIPIKSKTLSHTALYEVVLFQAVMPPDTVFEEVKCLPSANVATFTNVGVSIEDYWNMNTLFTQKETSYQKLVEGGRQALLETIQRTSDQNTITALSGGIDSGGLLGMYREALQIKRPKVVSVGPYGRKSGDLISARKSAKFNDAEAHEIYPEKEDLKKMWDWSLGLSQPISPSVMFVHNLMHEKGEQLGVKKIIYGLGAEMILGNLRVSKMAHKLWYEKLLPTSTVAFVYSFFDRFIESKTKSAFMMAVNDWVQRFMVVRGPFYPWASEYFIQDAENFWSQIKKKMKLHFDKNMNIYDAIVKLYLKSRVNYLQYRDMKILGSKFNITPVIPFDSLRVVKVLFATPLKHRKRNKWNKQLIRDIMQPYVADHLYSNPVKSLIVPYKDFFKGRETALFAYISTSSATKDLFDYKALKKDTKILPEVSFLLMHILGVAVWYDANFAPERKQEFLNIFK